jgi:hypothetical protein
MDKEEEMKKKLVPSSYLNNCTNNTDAIVSVPNNEICNLPNNQEITVSSTTSNPTENEISQDNKLNFASGLSANVLD